jgi:hypothetical protein
MGKHKMEKTDLVGERFGRLVVIAKTESHKKKHSRWVCKCDCGKTCITTGTSLRTGKKQSCNCLRSEVSKLKAAKNQKLNIKSGDEAAFNQIYSTYKWQAGKRDFTFELSKERFRELTQLNCHYCNTPPLQSYTTKGGSGVPFIYNGIDRVINSIGYTNFNCVTCCGTCNDMKRARTAEDFITACESVSIHQNHKRLAEMTSLSNLRC